MDTAFKIVFFLGVLIFCLLIVTVFLIIIKLVFILTPEITIFGIKMIPIIE